MSNYTHQTLSLRVDHTAAPQGSKSLWNGRLVESCKRLPAYRQAIRKVISAELPFEWNDSLYYECFLTFCFARSKSHFTTNKMLKANAPDHPNRLLGDIDKLSRAVLDALSGSDDIKRVWKDDTQVIRLHADKRFDDDNYTLIDVRQI